MSNSKKKNFWPQSIAALLMAAALLLVWTIIKTSTMPVHEENSFMHSYQDVDLNSDEIISQNNRFFQNFDIKIASKHEEKNLEGFYKQRNRTTNYIESKSPIVLEIAAIDEIAVEDAKMDVIITRPTTTADDKEVTVKKVEDNRFSIDLSSIDKSGRWQLVVKGVANGLTGYKNIDIYIQ